MKQNRGSLALAVAAVFVAPIASAAEDKVALSGFADILYRVTDDTTALVNNKSPTEGKFSAAAELDLVGKMSDKLTVRVDADLDLAVNDGTSAGGDSGRIEQAYFALAAMEKVTVLGGVFNNPIGWEGHDAPEMITTTHGQIWNIMDGQTALYANNVAGVAAAVNVGMATVTVGLLNDLQQSNEENSFAAAINMTPMTNFDLEVGYVTQASRQDSSNVGTYGNATVGSAENWYDINATYKVEKLLIAAEILGADKVVDMAYALYGRLEVVPGISVSGRFDSVGYQDPNASVKDTETITLAAAYQVDANLSVGLEWRTQDDANDTTSGAGGGVISDGDLVQLEILAKY